MNSSELTMEIFCRACANMGVKIVDTREDEDGSQILFITVPETFRSVVSNKEIKGDDIGKLMKEKLFPLIGITQTKIRYKVREGEYKLG